jgi:hypothetical protein
MEGFSGLGKILIIFGAILALVGLVLLFYHRIPWLGRLPGDIVFRKGNFTFYFPIVTSLLISVLITLLFALFRK